MRIIFPVLALAACGFAPPPAHAQRVPFINGGATGFDPEISVVNSGALLDAQVAVSNDLKYVTIKARPSNSQLLALRDFSFANRNNPGPALGFVGGAGAAANARPNGDPRRRLPARVGGNDDARNALDRRGTTRVGGLRD